METVVKNGSIVTPERIVRADVGISFDGKIVAIGDLSPFGSPGKVIDAEGKFVLPGAIDTHVHLRDPGFPEREDFESGTRAAAAGGITTVVDMPNSVPTVVTTDALKQKAAHCETRAVVDFGLYAGAGTDSVQAIGELASAGAMAFKTLMANFPTPGREREFLGLHLKRDDSIIDVVRAVAKTGVIHVFHCETDYMIRHEVERLRNDGRLDPLAHVESRPAFAEADAVARVLILAAALGDHAHIAHMSTSEGVNLVRDAKARHQRVSCETCAHYLLLTDKDMNSLKTKAKIQPPLRDKATQQALWDGLNSGVIDSICSDHSPFTTEEKNRDIWTALPGAPDMENMIPLMLDSVNEGRLTLTKLVEVSSSNPARLFGMKDRKGSMRVGSDADMIIVDMKLEKKIRAESMQTKGKSSTIFDGRKVKGWPVLTIVRGQTVFQDSDVVGKAGSGKWITPRYD